MGVEKSKMKFEGDLIGKIVYHKLLGKCLIVKAQDKFSETKEESKWEVRDTKGSILVVDRRELEEKPSKALRLRQYAHACRQLAKMVEAEAKSLENEDVS